jgi:hypothetical protein
MAVYVDDHRCPQTPGGWVSGWSHLFADTRPELLAFTTRLGLAPGTVCDTAAAVYVPVPEAVRLRALRLGAVPLHVGSSSWRSVVRASRAQVPSVPAGVAA